MNLTAGQRLGPYEIVAPIGAGGMGEVYRARDTRLDRTVAIKVLPAALAQSAQLRMRFEREAKAISSLAHPNICTLHDVGSHEGIEFLVMEHLEGESLADRLARGPLPVAEAIRHGIEIADALDKAHRRGIIHRDLKPGNVMITRGGAKLLDFGLARTIEAEPISADSATIAHKPLTEEGTIVGTVQYMAPEQLESKPADARTDIFAFGALLYEMLTGKRAFGGKSRASVIAAILAAEPQPVSAVQPLTPRALERVVRICLEKDPDDRWQSAHDVKLELQGVSADAPAVAAPRSRAALAGWIAAALVAAGAMAWVAWERSREQPRRSVRFEIAPPPDMTFDTTNAPAVVSPDGEMIAVGVDEGPTYGRIGLRRLGSTRLELLRGTEGGFDIFWSSDARQLAFFSGGKLRRFDLATSTAHPVCPAGDARGGTWAGDTILFSPGYIGPILRVPAAGGAAVPATKLNAARKETAHLRPSFLPDGRRFLFMAHSVDESLSGLYVGSLDSDEVQRVLDIAVPAQYASGRLLYVHDAILYSQPFDVAQAKTTGPGVPLVRGVGYTAQYSLPHFSAGANTLALHHGGAMSRKPLVRVRRNGAPAALPLNGENIDLARDGTRLAMMRIEGQRNPDIWVYDLRRGVPSRVTFDTAVEVGPVWSPDGRRLIYQVIGVSGSVLRVGSSSGGGASELFLAGAGAVEPVDWLRDGRTVLAERATIDAGVDLITIDVATRKVTPFAASPFEETSGRFSPDGRWLAYSSNESGHNELYLQPFPPDGTKLQVTSGGGESPRWTADGRTLFYVRRDGALMSVPIDGTEIGVPSVFAHISSVDYVISPDGSEAIVSHAQASASGPIHVTTHWQ